MKHDMEFLSSFLLAGVQGDEVLQVLAHMPHEIILRAREENAPKLINKKKSSYNICQEES